MRQCGDCQLCCKLLPVKSLAKLAGQRCSHQRHHKGCAVYKQLGRVSPECKLWNCRWLVEDDTEGLSRPDRSHYVIDLMPDFVTLRDDATGQANHVQVVQIWVDPKHPDAHRDPALARLPGAPRQAEHHRPRPLGQRGGDGDLPARAVGRPSMARSRQQVPHSRSHTVEEKIAALGPMTMHVVER